MKRFVLAAAVVLIGLAFATPAQARGYVAFGFGCCGGGYYPYYGAPAYYPPAYYPPSYYAYPTYYAPPPTVVYAAPSPTYIQQAPAPQTYQQPASTPSSAPVSSVNQASAPAESAESAETTTDSQGHTCRPFQSTVDGAPVNGTVCLQADGTWRTIGE